MNPIFLLQPAEAPVPFRFVHAGHLEGFVAIALSPVSHHSLEHLIWLVHEPHDAGGAGIRLVTGPRAREAVHRVVVIRLRLEQLDLGRPDAHLLLEIPHRSSFGWRRWREDSAGGSRCIAAKLLAGSLFRTSHS